MTLLQCSQKSADPGPCKFWNQESQVSGAQMHHSNVAESTRSLTFVDRLCTGIKGTISNVGGKWLFPGRLP